MPDVMHFPHDIEETSTKTPTTKSKELIITGAGSIVLGIMYVTNLVAIPLYNWHMLGSASETIQSLISSAGNNATVEVLVEQLVNLTNKLDATQEAQILPPASAVVISISSLIAGYGLFKLGQAFGAKQSNKVVKRQNEFSPLNINS
ncbi:MAG: hypothetical protein HKM04_00415 [Legionellales bacterium]|nr:hypothetical protein [Legionellales bacterium]